MPIGKGMGRGERNQQLVAKKFPMTKEPNPDQIPVPNDQIPMKSRFCTGRASEFFWDLVIGAWDLIGI
jgi:hypothetical protein